LVYCPWVENSTEEDFMEKETHIELDLDVYGWFEERERIMQQIEVGLLSLFKKHHKSTGDHRRTGCFQVELSLPKFYRGG
jgi:hypothetical protein